MAQEFDLNKFEHVHFLGIGGIGVSALARMMLALGKQVTGQDSSRSSVSDMLEQAGAKIFYRSDPADMPKETELIIYSQAVADQNPGFLSDMKAKKPTYSYPEILGFLSKNFFTIAVAGTHGKTTTTAMIAKILMDAGLDPTIIVGSVLNEQGSNFVYGKSKYLVVEADEYKKAFLKLSPAILVVTNVGMDHLDVYKDLSGIQKTFSELVSKVPKKGYVITRTNLKSVRPILENAKGKVIDYGEFLDGDLKLPLPGNHNKENAACALAVAHLLEIPKKQALESLSRFKGTWRRFDFKGKTQKGALVYDDYAHNPDKVKAALQGFRELYPESRLHVVFQPHLYSRTKLQLEEFAGAFNLADSVRVLPIFGAREAADPSISSEILAERIRLVFGAVPGKAKNLAEAVSEPEVLKFLSGLKKGEVAVVMGAGDIYKLAEQSVVKKKK